MLIPPPPPNPAVGGANVVQLLTGAMANMSAPVQSGFLGFSIELSVADQVLGKNGSFINPQLLNLLETISQRAGRCVVRIGGNTQENAVFFPQGLPNQETINKDKSNLTGPTNTPTLQVGIDLIYAMANISSLTNTHWFIGAPFDTPATPRLGIAEASERILGDRLLGLQVGNEPDLFESHQARAAPYNVPQYVAEFQEFVNFFKTDSNIQTQNSLIVPNTCCMWGVPELNEIGFFDTFNDIIKMIAIEHCNDYCINAETGQRNHDPQTEFATFMTHTNAVTFVSYYLPVSALAAQHGKPLMMMETNTASCGGLPGLSDSFGAALYLIDVAMQMAWVNFTGALLHVGGQSTYYNPFTPPPGSVLKRGGQWTVGGPYYAALIVAELIGSSGNAQVVDINPNYGNEYTPGYAVYENGRPVRAVLINFITDPSGANDYTAQIAIDGSG
ncbi:glycoside hydrolase family 79 protein, partial [Sphaerobolus stellatus SS14]